MTNDSNRVEGVPSTGDPFGLAIPIELGVDTAGDGYVACKRIFDVAVAGIALVLLTPVLAAIVVLVRMTSPGPGIFRQQRVGRGGRPFTLYKFRSMYEHTGDDIHRAFVQRYLRGQVADGDIGGIAPYKLRADPRITPVGRVLRRTSLDELPQLWNVLRGDMSLVGPRPPLPFEVAEYAPHHMRRLSVAPGVTGLWQVYGRSRVTFEEMVRLDLQYVVNRSLVLDVRIILATIPAIVRGKGAG